jgi:hypothetical protein
MFNPVVSVISVHDFGHGNVYSPGLAGVVHFITLSSCRSMATNSSEQLRPNLAACYRAVRASVAPGGAPAPRPLQSLSLGIQPYRMAKLLSCDGRAALLARLDPDRVKERQLHDAIFRKEWGNLFAVWDCCQDLQQE